MRDREEGAEFLRPIRYPRGGREADDVKGYREAQNGISQKTDSAKRGGNKKRYRACSDLAVSQNSGVDNGNLNSV